MDGTVGHLHARLKALVERLNHIEERIKEAELICGQVVFPAVNELRYMSRNLASLIDLALSDAGRRDTAERSVDSYFVDAEMCCVRADHDITDAIFAYVSVEVDSLRKQYGASMVAAHLDRYGDLIGHLQQAQKLIIESRGEKRTAERIRLYDSVRDNHIGPIIEIFQQLRTNMKLLREHYLAILKASRLNKRLGIVGIFGLIAGLASILSWFGYEWDDVDHLAGPEAPVTPAAASDERTAERSLTYQLSPDPSSSQNKDASLRPPVPEGVDSDSEFKFRPQQ